MEGGKKTRILGKQRRGRKECEARKSGGQARKKKEVKDKEKEGNLLVEMEKKRK